MKAVSLFLVLLAVFFAAATAIENQPIKSKDVDARNHYTTKPPPTPTPTPTPICCSVTEVDSTVPVNVRSVYTLPVGAQALIVGDRVYISDVLPMNVDGALPIIVEDGIQHQIQQAFDMLGSVLAGAGLERGDLIRVTIYARGEDSSILSAIDAAYSQFFSSVEVPPVKVVECYNKPPLVGLSVKIAAVAHYRHYQGESDCVVPKRAINLWHKTEPVAPSAILIGNEMYSSLIWRSSEGTLFEQAWLALLAMESLLEEEGMDRGDVVSVRVYLAAGESVSTLDDAFRKFFQGLQPPTRVVTTNNVFANPNVRVGLSYLAHKAPSRCNQINEKFNVDDFVYSEKDLYSHGVKIGNRIHTSGLFPTIPLSALNPPYSNVPSFPESFVQQFYQALSNVERVTERKGAIRNKWVWLNTYFSDLDGVFNEYTHLLANYLNGTASVPCPKAHSGGGLILDGAQMQAEAIAFVDKKPRNNYY